MRYDFFSILEKIIGKLDDRKDVIDIIKHELGENLEYLVTSFDLKKKVITFNGNIRLTPILRGDFSIGISIKREEKVGTETFKLTKNIVFGGFKGPGVIVSTLEEVNNSKYNIYFANTKRIARNSNKEYFIADNDLGLWIYDKNVVSDRRYETLFTAKTACEVYNFYSMYYSTTEKLKEQYILPDYFRIRHNIIYEEDDKLIDIIQGNNIFNNDDIVENVIRNKHEKNIETGKDAFNQSIYEGFESDDISSFIQIKTRFKPTSKNIFTYKDNFTKTKVKTKKEEK